ncbi:protein kinase domain-containing protein, partial [Streptomyces sp. URMC 123]|uniref:serine/threonine-protein kinase n=1 Tax=Streptomyces sp. URMC 123 TaxID=3423403 RepID=UPI003F1C83DA
MGETRLIHGRYRLLDLIGRGGMGEVWRARDESLGRGVAVKCLKPMGAQHDGSFTRVLRERFRREARVAAALQHPGITVVHDFGEYDGVLYLVMELLDGRNLSQLLEDNRQHPLPVPEIVDIAAQVSAALDYTHRQGIVHRDLKPANVMRLVDGTVKICDFGIARLGHDIGFTARLTGTGIAMGTPHYMSPEQIAGSPVDHRSDLYSLGCVLYELATGAPPFDLEDAWAVLVGHRDTAPEPPRRQRPDLPEQFERIVLDLLAKDPAKRPRDAAELGGRIAVARAPVALPISRETPPEAVSPLSAHLVPPRAGSPYDSRYASSYASPGAAPPRGASEDGGAPPAGAVPARDSERDSGQDSRQAPEQAPEPGAPPPAPVLSRPPTLAGRAPAADARSVDDRPAEKPPSAPAERRPPVLRGAPLTAAAPVGPAPSPAPSAGRPSAPPSRLPAWARALTSGSKAFGTGARRPAPPDRTTGLTEHWTGRPGTRTGDGIRV